MRKSLKRYSLAGHIDFVKQRIRRYLMSATLTLCILGLSFFVSFAQPDEPNAKDDTTTTETFSVEKHRKSALHKVLMYVPNRALDLIDCVRANISLGFGIGGNVRVTEALQAGIATYETSRLGLSNNRLRLVYHEWSVEMGIGPYYTRRSNQTRHPTEIGATAHLGILGAEAAVNIQEVCDFFTGWFMCDLQRDDF